MIRSMTGFGEAEQEVEGGTLRLSLKSVNHRFLHISVRLPSGNDHLEAPLGACLKKRLHRGHVSCGLAFERVQGGASGPLPALDLDRARAYKEAFDTLAGELGVTGEPDFNTWARFGDLFKSPEGARTVHRFEADVVLPLMDTAVDGLIGMREVEGGRLKEDMCGRTEAIASLVEKVEVRAPERLRYERDRLRTAISELAGTVEVDDDRLAREVAYIAEKWDINEEIVRLRSHLALFDETLENADDEAVGKRLGFVIQEMHREANTIGSKANDIEISHAAVGLKEEIERLREQIENVE